MNTERNITRIYYFLAISLYTAKYVCNIKIWLPGSCVTSCVSTLMNYVLGVMLFNHHHPTHLATHTGWMCTDTDRYSLEWLVWVREGRGSGWMENGMIAMGEVTEHMCGRQISVVFSDRVTEEVWVWGIGWRLMFLILGGPWTLTENEEGASKEPRLI